MSFSESFEYLRYGYTAIINMFTLTVRWSTLDGRINNQLITKWIPVIKIRAYSRQSKNSQILHLLNYTFKMAPFKHRIITSHPLSLLITRH